MSPKEKQAPPQVAFVFPGPLTNGQPAVAGSRARKRGPVSEAPVPPADAIGTFFFLSILYIRKYEQITDM